MPPPWCNVQMSHFDEGRELRRGCHSYAPVEFYEGGVSHCFGAPLGPASGRGSKEKCDCKCNSGRLPSPRCRASHLGLLNMVTRR